MSAGSVLVAFASQLGSTAGIAETIAHTLQTAGLQVDLRRAAEVHDIDPYCAVILGSGVYLVRQASDGGGFLVRHADALQDRPFWLFSAGPIGAIPLGGGATSARVGGRDSAAVVLVAAAVGARGAATFASNRPSGGPASSEELEPQWRDDERVRAWARSIAAELLGMRGHPSERPMGRSRPRIRLGAACAVTR